MSSFSLKFMIKMNDVTTNYSKIKGFTAQLMRLDNFHCEIYESEMHTEPIEIPD